MGKITRTLGGEAFVLGVGAFIFLWGYIWEGGRIHSIDTRLKKLKPKLVLNPHYTHDPQCRKPSSITVVWSGRCFPNSGHCVSRTDTEANYAWHPGAVLEAAVNLMQKNTTAWVNNWQPSRFVVPEELKIKKSKNRT